MNSYREAQRLGQMESTLRQEQEKYQQRRDTGTGNRRNQSQVQYDLMTLDYKSTPGGQALKQQVRAGGPGQSCGQTLPGSCGASLGTLQRIVPCSGGENSNSLSAWLIRKIGLWDSGGRSLLACALVMQAVLWVRWSMGHKLTELKPNSCIAVVCTGRIDRGAAAAAFRHAVHQGQSHHTQHHHRAAAAAAATMSWMTETVGKVHHHLPYISRAAAHFSFLVISRDLGVGGCGQVHTAGGTKPHASPQVVIDSNIPTPTRPTVNTASPPMSPMRPDAPAFVPSWMADSYSYAAPQGDEVSCVQQRPMCANWSQGALARWLERTRHRASRHPV